MDGEGYEGSDACSGGRSECPDDADADSCVVVTAADAEDLLLLLDIIRYSLKRYLKLPLMHH